MKYDYHVLDEEQIMRIHQTSLRVLGDVGMKVLEDKLRGLLSKKGLAVNDKQQLVHFPKDMVEAALAAAPRRVSMSDHKGNRFALDTGNELPGVYSNALSVWDWHTKEVRRSTVDDLVTCVKLAEAIPDVKLNATVCLPGDSPHTDQAMHAVCILLQHSTKIGNAAPQCLAEAIFWEEAVAVAQQDLAEDRPSSVAYCISPTNPLQLCRAVSEILQYLAGRNTVLVISSCPIAGGTSPVTMAGTAVQTHAEFLGILTIAQLLREGVPCVYGGSAGPMDLRVGQLCYGVPERNTMLCANIDIARHFGLPHFSSAGSVDSAAPDFQTGQSKAAAFLSRLMMGTNLGISFGCLLTGSTVAPEQIVLDVEVYRAAKAMLRGMTVDEERLAYEAIKRVGPGGNYLADEHTVAFMRSEYYQSEVINHQGESGRSMIDRAHDQVEKILRNHQPAVSEKVQSDLAKLLREREKEREKVSGTVS